MARNPRRLPPPLGRRGGHRIEPKLKLLIFCEGKNTEPAYFEGLAHAFGNRLVRVETERGAGVPKTLVEKALARKRSLGRPQNSFEEGDQIWVVFDMDEHPLVLEAINLAKSHHIGVAFPNPCFEIWGIIHLRDFDAPVHRHDAQKLLSTLMKGYDAAGAKALDLEKLLPSTGAACARASRMRERRVQEGRPLGCPYTDVDLLAQLIIENGKPA